jgi:short subunit dehydrogenase-like uncharacterized protein
MVYEVDDRGSIPGRCKRCSILYSVQTGSGVHPVSYPMATGDSFPGVKLPDVKLTIHLRLVPRSRMVELYVFMAWCLIN